MRKHQLMDPAFPDLVGAWAAQERNGIARGRGGFIAEREPDS